MTNTELSEAIDSLAGIEYVNDYGYSNYSLKLGICNNKVVRCYKVLANGKEIPLNKLEGRDEILMLARARVIMNNSSTVFYDGFEVDLIEV